MKTVAATSRLRQRERILKQETEGTVVLLDVDDGRYYALEGVGGRVWELCDGTRTVSQTAQAIEEEYAAAPERIGLDLIELLTDLLNEDLVVEITPAVDGAPRPD